MLQRESLFGRTTPKTPAEIKPPTPAGTPSAHPNNAAGGTTTDDGHRSVRPNPPRGDEAPGNKLVVGPNIRMKGVEITDCDTLVVEGHIEATIDSRLMQIAPNGSYTGTAAIDTAEIHGTFTGDLSVRKRLTVHASGKVSGKINYSQMIIEEGGEIAGDVTRLPESVKSVRNSAVVPAPVKTTAPSQAPATVAYPR
jgi:cytoskeletal protein CcmA (bactofilin family)